ncbi:hypothetical protein, partial [Thermogutta sp.]|uniref:hypothetical protein n=1 Tax=Thermogutta sp. TaxID=1962930 RepID=UPI00321FBD93
RSRTTSSLSFPLPTGQAPRFRIHLFGYRMLKQVRHDLMPTAVRFYAAGWILLTLSLRPTNPSSRSVQP